MRKATNKSHVNRKCIQKMYRKHVCMSFSEVEMQCENASKTYIFLIHGCKNCNWLINLMFYTLENGTKMFADHENLGINFLILKIYWVFMEIWGKYHFPIMAPTKWPPFWPEGEIDVAPYPKTFTMTKGMSVPSFMLVPQNARFFHISLGLLGLLPLIARFMGPTWGPSGADRTQVGPTMAPWTLLSGTSIFAAMIFSH